MRKIFCDNCGKELSDSGFYTVDIKVSKVSAKRCAIEQDPFHKEFCENCWTDIGRFYTEKMEVDRR